MSIYYVNGLLAISEATKFRVLGPVLLLVFLAGARNVPRIWKHETTFYDTMFPWWVWGETLWRAFIRCMVFGWVCGSILCVAITYYAYFGDLDRDVAPLWFAIPGGANLIIGAILLITVTFFNWPKFVVPPHLRDQPGALREWLDDWRKRRST